MNEMPRNLPRLDLYIPEPTRRPGEAPDFSALAIPEAGAMPRPDVAAPAEATRPLAFGRIRVLDGAGRAVGAWDPRRDLDTLRRGLRAMMLTRAYDARMVRVQRQGKTSFYMKCTGEEAIAGA